MPPRDAGARGEVDRRQVIVTEALRRSAGAQAPVVSPPRCTPPFDRAHVVRRAPLHQPGLAQRPSSTDDSAAFLSLRPPHRASLQRRSRVEFLNFVLMLVIAWLVFRKPEKERLAFRLLVVSVVLMVVLFSIATRTSLLPAVNY